MVKREQAHVSAQKKATVAELTRQIKASPIVAVLDMESLPAGNLASMRKKMRADVHMVMAKKRLIKRALEESGVQGSKELAATLTGMPALLFTKSNPFTLFKTLKKNQSKAPIKGGQIAPYDLIIPAGPTSFPPGPIIGELGGLGIKGGIEQGKVVIKADATLAKAGQVVDDKRAAFLTRMGIEPMRIGLKLVAALEKGEILTGAVLDIDEVKFLRDLQNCALEAQALAFNAAIPMKENIDKLIQKGHYEAAGLALEANLVTDENAREVLAKAYWQAMGVAKYLPEGMRDEMPEAVAEAAAEPAHEKKEEKSETDAAAGLGSLFG
jgi:large subunit ribosomal protein L10